MPRRIFLTGGSGFVGRRLTAALVRAGLRVVALDRSGVLSADAEKGLEVIRGDVLAPESYQDALATCDIALHLAAATGRAGADQHFRINVQGTEALLRACRHARVQRIVFVSSIAVTFSDLSGYHYAQAKAQAEDAVRRSGLEFLIVRPTMILGPGAPVLGALEKLATLPVAVIPGTGRVRVQPIFVDEVVACLVAAVGLDSLGDEIVALGGAETISMMELLQRIRVARRGKPGPIMRVPLIFLQPPLRLAEALGLGRLLPITAGQLSSFRFDGVGGPNRLQSASDRPRALIAEMLDHAPPALPSSSNLAAEATVFTRYLLGCEANDYVRAKYAAAHAALPALETSERFDGFLVRFARRGPLFARLADAHSALFARSSLLRKKLVVLLAILESAPPFHATIDEPVGGRPAPALVSLAVTGITAIAALVVGSLVLVPVRLLLAVAPGDRR